MKYGLPTGIQVLKYSRLSCLAMRARDNAYLLDGISKAYLPIAQWTHRFGPELGMPEEDGRVALNASGMTSWR